MCRLLLRTIPSWRNYHHQLFVARRLFSSESSSSSSSSSPTSSPMSTPSTTESESRLHSTDIAFKPAESGWGGGRGKYTQNYNSIFKSKTANNNISDTKIEERRMEVEKMNGVYKLGTYIPKIAASCWIAPNAAVVGNVIMLEKSSVWFGATVRGDNPEPIMIGERTNVQDGAVLHSDAGVPLTIGAGVTVGHRATLHGCTVGDNTLIGIGATVLNKSVIGKNCVIGAHSLVPENKTIPDGSLVIGTKGEVVRTLTEKQIDMLNLGADHYVKNQNWFKESLQLVVDDGADISTQSKL